jgi:hypothetical protein
MVGKQGYYTRDTGQNVYPYYMGDEPPLEQYRFNGSQWVPLDDPWHLMDQIIDGSPEISGPTQDPPKRVSAIKVS